MEYGYIDSESYAGRMTLDDIQTNKTTTPRNQGHGSQIDKTARQRNRIAASSPLTNNIVENQEQMGKQILLSMFGYIGKISQVWAQGNMQEFLRKACTKMLWQNLISFNRKWYCLH
uniref:Uncharacterized protein n=1 Tax=Glossina palpalis gambiensis TaxID=67801 RepID=A0A1B0BWX9_9MUSC